MCSKKSWFHWLLWPYFGLKKSPKKGLNQDQTEETLQKVRKPHTFWPPIFKKFLRCIKCKLTCKIHLLRQPLHFGRQRVIVTSFILGLGLMPIKNIEDTTMKAGLSKPLFVVTLLLWFSIFYMFVAAIYNFLTLPQPIEHIADDLGSVTYYGFGFLLLYFFVKFGQKIGPFLRQWSKFEVHISIIL